MGNSLSQPLQGHAAAASDAPYLPQGPVRLPLALNHSTAAHAAAEAATPPASSSSTSPGQLSKTAQPGAQQQLGKLTASRQGTPGGSVSSSSSSSSSASSSSRGFTSDDTMPWRGSSHGSQGSMPDLVDAASEGQVTEAEDVLVDIPDKERCLQCSLLLPAGPAGGNGTDSSAGTAGVRLLACPAVRTGQLFLHPNSNKASAEQLVWVLPQQQLQASHGGSKDSAAASATAPALQLVSPAFVLPCPALGGSSSGSSSAGRHEAFGCQHVAIGWCLLLHPMPSSSSRPPGLDKSSSSSSSHVSSTASTSSSWQLLLCATWSAGSLPDAITLPQQQQKAPAGPKAAPQPDKPQSSTGTAAMCGWQLQCSGRVELLLAPAGSGNAAGPAGSTAGSDFQVLLQHSNQEAALPLTICHLDCAEVTSSVSCKPTEAANTSNSPADQLKSSDAMSAVPVRASSDSSSDVDRASDQATKPNSEAAAGRAVTSVPGRNLHDSEHELLVLLTFNQLQLLPSTTTITTTTSSSSMQSEQQTIVNLQPAGPTTTSSSSSNCQVNPVPEPYPRSHSNMSGPNTTSSSTTTTIITATSSSTTAESVKQMALASSSTEAATCSLHIAKRAATLSVPPTAVPVAAAAPAAVTERRLVAVLLSTAPRLLVVDDFFDAGLCEGLMELARDKLVRSRVASGSETPSRTSWSHFFVKEAAKHPLVVTAEAYIEALFGCAALRGPHKALAKVEALQVIKYHKGEFYHEHYDNRADSPLTRAATIIIYLCDTGCGGATSFPRAVLAGHAAGSFVASPSGTAGATPGSRVVLSGGGEQGGIGKELGGWRLPPKVSVGACGVGVKVLPVRGRAVIFWSKRPDGNEDPNSIHAADTVEHGEKWIATRWMKDEQ